MGEKGTCEVTYCTFRTPRLFPTSVEIGDGEVLPVMALSRFRIRHGDSVVVYREKCLKMGFRGW